MHIENHSAPNFRQPLSLRNWIILHDKIEEIGDLVFKLATHCMQRENLPAARRYAEIMVRHERETKRRAISYLKLGGILEAMRDYAAAAECLAWALRTEPRASRAYLHLAQIKQNHLAEVTNPKRLHDLLAECRAELSGLSIFRYTVKYP